jgi:disulfide bond formation protein DsbB
MPPHSTETPDELNRTAVPPGVVALPLIVALAALIGSLWLSMGMSLRACPLCFYQRTFVMGVVAVLVVGLLAGPRHRGVLNLLVLPLAVAGFGVALFHVWLELSGKLECPAGVLGIGTAPQQSLAVFTVLVAAVVLGMWQTTRAGDSRPAAAFAGVVVGGLLSWASVASSPPMPPVPTKAYDTPLDICRPPFRSQ